MSLSSSISKLYHEHGIIFIILVLAALYGLFLFYKHLAKKGYVPSESMDANNEAAYQKQRPSGSSGSVAPAPMAGQPDFGNADAAANSAPMVASMPGQNPSDLLPKDQHSEWQDYQQPPNSSNISLMSAGWALGVGTLNGSKFNGSLDLRSEPCIPMQAISPWNNPGHPTDCPGNSQRPAFEIGQGPL